MGVGVRVIAGERTGYAYSDDLSPEKIRKAANVAACIAAAPAKVEKFDLNEGRKHNLYPVLTAPTETAFAERVDLVKRADRAARAYDPRIFQVQAIYADNLRQVMVATSDGGSQLDRQPLARLSVSALARQNGGPPQRGHAGGGGRVELDFFLKEKTPEHFAREAAREADRHAGRGGSAGRRDDRGAGPGLARASCCTKPWATAWRPISTARASRPSAGASARRWRASSAPWSTTAPSAAAAARSTWTTKGSPRSATS